MGARNPKYLMLAALLLALHAGAAPAQEVPQPVSRAPFVLGEPPVAPQSFPSPPGFSIESFPPGGLVIDTQDREAVRTFYRGVYSQSEDVPMAWTGSYTGGGNPGTTSLAFQNATALRVNWYRAMAGIPANISFNAQFSTKDQRAALMMSANGALNHFPPSDWIFFAADGYEAAGKSNLALGSSGPDAVNGYIQDPGDNAPLGHRRWMLYAQTLLMGTGDVPGTTGTSPLAQANALWVLDDSFGDPRPPVRDTFIAWPPKGYVPYQVVFGRWSLSYPGADFSAATVSVKKGGGAELLGTIESRASPGINDSYGENTLVWQLTGFNDSSVRPRPASDETYTVVVSGVTGQLVPPSFTYNVVIFDPDVVTPAAPLATASAPATVSVGSAFTGSVGAMSGASGYQLGLYRTNALSGALTPTNSQAFWIPTTSGYSPYGSTEFHLYHAQFEDQTLALGTILYVGANASLTFDSRLGYVTATESAKVQLSLDGGVSWQDIYSRSGPTPPPPPNNVLESSAPVSVNLAAFSGRTIRLRFVFALGGGSIYNDPNSCATLCGWFFKNVAFNNVSALTLVDSATLPPSPPTASLTAPTAANYVLFARAEYQGTYFGDWGPGFAVQAVTADLVLPSVPTAVIATGVNSSQITVNWTASTDNVGVTQYKVYRNTDGYTTPIGTVSGATLSYGDAGLPASTARSYKVAACDAAANCSAQSALASATTLAAGSVNFTPVYVAGFNQSGNPSTSALNVSTAFGTFEAPVPGISDKVEAVWAWNATAKKWKFHSPQFPAATLAAFIAANNYEALTSVPPGAGYWVSAVQPVSLPAQSGTSYDFDQTRFAALPPSFNLLSTGSTLTVSQFHANVGAGPTNFISLWAWDAVRSKWYFYSPMFEGPGAPFSNAFYTAQNGFQDFGGGTPPAPAFNLQPGAGFWVEK